MVGQAFTSSTEQNSFVGPVPPEFTDSDNIVYPCRWGSWWIYKTRSKTLNWRITHNQTSQSITPIYSHIPSKDFYLSFYGAITFTLDQLITCDGYYYNIWDSACRCKLTETCMTLQREHHAGKNSRQSNDRKGIITYLDHLAPNQAGITGRSHTVRQTRERKEENATCCRHKNKEHSTKQCKKRH